MDKVAALDKLVKDLFTAYGKDYQRDRRLLYIDSFEDLDFRYLEKATKKIRRYSDFKDVPPESFIINKVFDLMREDEMAVHNKTKTVSNEERANGRKILADMHRNFKEKFILKG